MREERYDYYAERVTRFLVEEELIFEDEQYAMEQFIRGCA